MSHFVCQSCGGVSDHAKVCETGGCVKEGHDLTECNCSDGKHAELNNNNKELSED